MYASPIHEPTHQRDKPAHQDKPKGPKHPQAPRHQKEPTKPRHQDRTTTRSSKRKPGHRSAPRQADQALVVGVTWGPTPTTSGLPH